METSELTTIEATTAEHIAARATLAESTLTPEWLSLNNEQRLHILQWLETHTTLLIPTAGIRKPESQPSDTEPGAGETIETVGKMLEQQSIITKWLRDMTEGLAPTDLVKVTRLGVGSLTYVVRIERIEQEPDIEAIIEEQNLNFLDARANVIYNTAPDYQMTEAESDAYYAMLEQQAIDTAEQSAPPAHDQPIDDLCNGYNED